MSVVTWRIAASRSFILDVAATVGVLLPLQPFGARVGRVEIGDDLEAEITRERRDVLADQQVVIVCSITVTWRQRRQLDVFARADAASLLLRAVHAARVELHDAVGVRQAAVADAVVERIEPTILTPAMTASSTSWPFITISNAVSTHVFVPPFLNW
jgi:hypothetical protein